MHDVVYVNPPQSFTTHTTTSNASGSWWFDMPDDPEGLAGVREPRRPIVPAAPVEAEVR